MKGNTILLHCTIDQQNSFSWFRVKNTFIHSQFTKKLYARDANISLLKTFKQIQFLMHKKTLNTFSSFKKNYVHEK